MPFPGVNVTFGTSAPAAGAPTDTGQWFIAGLTQKGIAGVPVKVSSLSGFVTQCGGRQTDSVIYDSVETALREGATTIFVSRLVGPTPINATHTFLGAASAASITVKAKGPGFYGNALLVAVLAGLVSGFRLQTSNASGVLETSPDLADVPAAVAYTTASGYINVTADGVAVPVAISATALTSGTDDRTNVTTTQWSNALAAFSPSLGPGQVSLPGQSTSTLDSAVVAHCAASNRVALLDVPNSTTFGDLTAAATAIRPDANGAYGGLFGPWVNIPGIVPGTTRAVPYSAVEAGLIARSDRYFNAGRAVAGFEFPLQYAVSFTQYTDDQIQTASLAGLNLAKNVNGSLQTYGFRSVVDPSISTDWVQFSNARLRMAIAATLNSVAGKFVFSQLDGAGHTILAFKDALTGVLTDFYAQGALYGDTAADAFRVDVGDAINTPTTLGNGELHAVVAVRMSPFAEVVFIDVAKTPITQTV